MGNVGVRAPLLPAVVGSAPCRSQDHRRHGDAACAETPKIGPKRSKNKSQGGLSVSPRKSMEQGRTCHALRLPGWHRQGLGGSRVNRGMRDASQPMASHPFPGLSLHQQGMIPVHERADSHLQSQGRNGSIQQCPWLS